MKLNETLEYPCGLKINFQLTTNFIDAFTTQAKLERNAKVDICPLYGKNCHK